MLITIRSPKLLRFFGRGTYNGKPRETYPSYVTASHRLWLRWFTPTGAYETMGQYHLAVNLDKREFIDPHKLGCGLKLWEQLANHPGTGTALIVLLAHPEPRGGGDLQPDPIIGRWRGDRLALIGDYSEDSDIVSFPPASTIYALCRDGEAAAAAQPHKLFTDVTDDVCRVIERELNGKFVGSGWRDFTPNAE